MDKRFVKNLVLHIPHHLRDLLWMVRVWSSNAPIFFFLESAKSNHFLLAYILCMNESHDLGRQFKVAITTSAFSVSSSTASRCYAFWIFTFFNCSIFWIIFLSSNSLIKESNIFGVFREDTCGTSWSVIESTMIFLALIKFFLCKALSLISVWNWNLSTYVGVQLIFFREIIYFHAWKLSTLPILSSSWCDRSLWNENLKCK